MKAAMTVPAARAIWRTAVLTGLGGGVVVDMHTIILPGAMLSVKTYLPNQHSRIFHLRRVIFGCIIGGDMKFLPCFSTPFLIVTVLVYENGGQIPCLASEFECRDDFRQ
jgi:hypothetical protein